MHQAPRRCLTPLVTFHRPLPVCPIPSEWWFPCGKNYLHLTYKLAATVKLEFVVTDDLMINHVTSMCMVYVFSVWLSEWFSTLVLQFKKRSTANSTKKVLVACRCPKPGNTVDKIPDQFAFNSQHFGQVRTHTLGEVSINFTRHLYFNDLGLQNSLNMVRFVLYVNICPNSHIHNHT